jgi:hypothetical protein
MSHNAEHSRRMLERGFRVTWDTVVVTVLTLPRVKKRTTCKTKNLKSEVRLSRLSLGCLPKALYKSWTDRILVFMMGGCFVRWLTPDER